MQIPKFVLEDVEDYYTYYVQVLGISEEVFWNCDYSFVVSVARNKQAFDNWMQYEEEKRMEEEYGKK